MDLYEAAIEELALEGLEGANLTSLWVLLESRQPPLSCALDKWTKPYLWTRLVQCQHIDVFHVDFSKNKHDYDLKMVEKSNPMLEYWINTLDGKHVGYSESFLYRTSIKSLLLKDGEVTMTMEDAENKWGNDLRLVVDLEVRQRILFGANNSPDQDNITSVRYIVLELIAKTRWKGFVQADFLNVHHLDSRSTFHHIKILQKYHMITKQTVKMMQRSEKSISTKLIHLRRFSTISVTNTQRNGMKICKIIADAPDQIIERNQLRLTCSDIPGFKKIRQWLYHHGYINYIINGRVWSFEQSAPLYYQQLRGCRPCYVTLGKPMLTLECDDDKDEDILDYVENCRDLEPKLIFETTLHQQAYHIMQACKGEGVTTKQLAQTMCLPHQMARSLVRFFDTNKIGRIISEDFKKLKVQKIVAIQYLHESETVSEIKKNQMKGQHHRNENNEKSLPTSQCTLGNANGNMTIATQVSKNLELADDISLVRVHEKNKVSLRHLSRENFILDMIKGNKVVLGFNEIYRGVLEMERENQCVCCRKTLRKILRALIEDRQIITYKVVTDAIPIPPLTEILYCAPGITPSSEEYKTMTKSLLQNNLPEEKIPEKKVESGTDTEDEATYEKCHPNYYITTKYRKYRRIQLMHYFLWYVVKQEKFTTSTENITEPSHRLSMWTQEPASLPEYNQGKGWFKVRDIIQAMSVELLVALLGLRVKSATAKKYLESQKRRHLPINKLPPRLRCKISGTPNKGNLDSCIDLLVYMAQMGLVAVNPHEYPCQRADLMLYLRENVKIVDTRLSLKGYDITMLPDGMNEFPALAYRLKSFADVERYWADLSSVCLNTPLGSLSKHVEQRHAVFDDDVDDVVNTNTVEKTRVKYTTLRDFQDYYLSQDFTNMSPIIFGNGRGAAGFDSIAFAHLPSNWMRRNFKKKLKEPVENVKHKIDVKKETVQKISVPQSAVNTRRGGKGLKRKLSEKEPSLTKTEKQERQALFNQLMEKRHKKVKEIIRTKEASRKAQKKQLYNRARPDHDDADRDAIKKMTGVRVTFSECEDAHVVISQIIYNLMNLYDQGQPLHRCHSNVIWRVFRDIIHKGVAESRDKTAISLRRRAVYIQKFYERSNQIRNACVSELRQNNEFMQSIQCTKTNWKEKLNEAFVTIKRMYSHRFSSECKTFPLSLVELKAEFEVQCGMCTKEQEKSLNMVANHTKTSIRVYMLQDLIHNLLSVQTTPGYTPMESFKVFDAYPLDELEEAFRFLKDQKLLTRLRMAPNTLILPMSTKSYTFSNVYHRVFYPSVHLKVFPSSRGFHFQLRDGKLHSKQYAESSSSLVKGALELLPSSLVGGHVAYLLSAMACRKVNLKFEIPDEIVSCNQAYMDSLVKKDSNFQKVVYQQRVKRGCIALEKKKRKLNAEATETSDEVVGVKLRNDVSLDPAIEKPRLKNYTQDVTRTVECEAEETNAATCSRNDINFSVTKSCMKQTSKGNKSVSFSDNKLFGRIHILLGADDSTMCSFAVNNAKTSAREFVYSAKPHSSVKPIKVNPFTENGLCANRTNLMIYRNVYEAVPSKAMNIHDSLMLMPVKMKIQSKRSPWRGKVTSKKKKLVERLKEESKVEQDEKGLTIDEYCIILRKEMNQSEDVVLCHIEVLNKIKIAGVNGVPRHKIMSLVTRTSKTFHKNVPEQIQTMLNFEMVYEMGIDVACLVDPSFIYPWCFKSEKRNKCLNEGTKEVNKNKTDQSNGDIAMVISHSEPMNGTHQSNDDVAMVISHSEPMNVECVNSANHTNVIEIPALESDKITTEESSESVVKEGDDEKEVQVEESRKETKEKENEKDIRVTQRVKITPWLKLDGELNGATLKRFQETLLVFIMERPGVKESAVLKEFGSLLRPYTARTILNFLVLNGCVTKHCQPKVKVTLFDSIISDEMEDGEVYYLPVPSALLNMMDMNR